VSTLSLPDALPICLPRAPLLVPDLKARDVKLDRPVTPAHSGRSVHEQLSLGDGHAAGIACFPVTGTPPDRRGAAVGEATVVELFTDLFTDEDTKSLGVHRLALGVWRSGSRGLEHAWRYPRRFPVKSRCHPSV